ncbi:MAG: DUF4115 domain-containing protein [Rhodospirillaceae bacterium]|nr:DUF4115 domain-containing protein [Rhodospirillaceae bacterium]
MGEAMSEAAETSGISASDTGVGALLRASRQRVGDDLREIAVLLRIRLPYLEAIEDGRFKELPGQTYAVGFIRAYAEHLGLDSDEVVRRYKEEVAGTGPRTDLQFPTPVTETGVPGGALMLIGVLVAILAYGGWYLSTSKDNFFADLIAPLPDRLADLVAGDQPAPMKTASETPPIEGEGVTTPEKSEPKKPEPPVENVATEAAVTPPTEPMPEPTPKPAAEPAPTPAPVAEAVTGGSAVIEKSPTAPQPTQSTVAQALPTPAADPAPPAATSTVDAAAQAIGEQAAATTESVTQAAQPSVKAVSEASTPPTPTETTISPAPTPTPLAPVPAAVTASGTQTESSVVPAPETLTETVAEPSAEPAPEPESEPVLPSRVLVRAKTNSWIQVQDDFSKETLVTRLLKEGEEYEVPNQTGLRLLTGNAGALEILVDGASVPPIGEEGAVRRGVLLDPELLKSGNAVGE